MQFATIQRLLGIFLMGYSITLVPPIFVSYFYADGQIAGFGEVLGAVFALGLLMWLPVRDRRRELRVKDGFILTAMFWTVFSAIGCIPFLVSLELSFADALFESVSGFTTTGATVIVGLDELPRSILYYRSQLQWLGGMGMVVLAVAIAPMLGVGGMQLYRAETPGPVKDNKLTPRITETARALWLIYSGLTLACGVAYWAAGMAPFDALCHAFTTIATAGFSTHDASLGFYDSPLIESVAIVFMLVGAVNFALHFAVLNRAAFRNYLVDSEARALVTTMLIVTAIMGTVLWATEHYAGATESFRRALFQVVSILTTTGYTTADFSAWPLFLPVMLLFLSFIGGCAGSTSGGMKVVRWLLVYKQGKREIMSLIHPRAVLSIKLSGRPVQPTVVHAVWGFFSVYMITFGFFMLLMLATGVDQVTAFAAVASCLNNLGPALGDVSANFIALDDSAMYIASVAMLFGRLEIFTFLVLLNPAFWRH